MKKYLFKRKRARKRENSSQSSGKKKLSFSHGGSLVFDPSESLKSFSLFPHYQSSKLLIPNLSPVKYEFIYKLLNFFRVLSNFKIPVLAKLVLINLIPVILVFVFLGESVISKNNEVKGIQYTDKTLSIYSVQKEMFKSMFFMNQTLEQENNTLAKYIELEIYKAGDENKNYSTLIYKMNLFLEFEIIKYIDNGLINSKLLSMNSYLKFLLMQFLIYQDQPQQNSTENLNNLKYQYEYLSYIINYIDNELYFNDLNLTDFSDIETIFNGSNETLKNQTLQKEIIVIEKFVSSIQTEFYKREGYLISWEVITLSLIIGLTVAECFIFYYMSKSILQPWIEIIERQIETFKRVESISESIATLDLQSSSILKLLNQKFETLSIVEVQLLTIVENMIEIKRFIPETLFTLDNNDMNESTNTLDSDNSDDHNADDDNSSNSRKSGESTSSTIKVRNKILNSRLGLVDKQVTLLVIDMDKTHHLTQSLTPIQFIKIHTSYIDEINKAIKKERGCIHYFKGDQIFASFNTIRKCSTHQICACKAALNCKKAMEHLHKQLVDSGLPTPKIRIGITTGNVYFGNLGTENLKHYSVIGALVNKTFAITKLNKYYKTEILIDSHVYGIVQYYFTTKLIDIVKFYKNDNVSYKKIRIYEIYKEKVMKNDEWLYMVAQSEKLNREFYLYNNAWDLFLKGNIEDAQKKIDEYVFQNKKNQQGLRVQLLFHSYETNKNKNDKKGKKKKKRKGEKYYTRVGLDPGCVLGDRYNSHRNQTIKKLTSFSTLGKSKTNLNKTNSNTSNEQLLIDPDTDILNDFDEDTDDLLYHK